MANLKFDFLHAYETGERRESEPANAYQYDEGHVLEAVLPEVITSCEIHYWIRGMEEAEAYTPTSITPNADSSCTVLGNIPNSYFETNGELRIYIVVTDGDASITTYEGYVHICQRSMPEDYVDDDPENEATRVLTEAQTAAATATAAAETCEEVLESIPEDYSTLSDDVEDLKDGFDDLKEDINGIVPAELGEFYTKYYKVSTNNDYMYIKIADNQLVAGDEYRLIITSNQTFTLDEIMIGTSGGISGMVDLIAENVTFTAGEETVIDFVPSVDGERYLRILGYTDRISSADVYQLERTLNKDFPILRYDYEMALTDAEKDNVISSLGIKDDLSTTVDGWEMYTVAMPISNNVSYKRIYNTKYPQLIAGENYKIMLVASEDCNVSGLKIGTASNVSSMVDDVADTVDLTAYVPSYIDYTPSQSDLQYIRLVNVANKIIAFTIYKKTSKPKDYTADVVENSIYGLAKNVGHVTYAVNSARNKIDKAVDGLLKVQLSTPTSKTITLPSIGAKQHAFVRIGMHYGASAFTPASDDVFFDGSCNTDFSDVRFFDASGKMLKAELGEPVNLDLLRDTKLNNYEKHLSDGTLISFSDSTGISLSRDSGVTWIPISGTANVTEHPCAVHNYTSMYPILVDSSDNIYAHAGGKLYKLLSADGYATKNEVLDFSWDDDGTMVYPFVQPHAMIEENDGTLIVGACYQEQYHVNVYVSRDNGNTFSLSWYRYGDDPNYQHVHNVSYDPYNEVTYVQIDDGGYSYIGSRIIMTDDHGDTWTELTTTANHEVRGRDYYPTYFGDGTYRLGGGETYIMGKATIYRSEDDVHYDCAVKGVAGVRSFADFGDDSLIVCGSQDSIVAHENHIFVSEDQGKTWSSVAKYDQPVSSASGKGWRRSESAFTPYGESESCVIITKDGGNVPTLRIYKGGNHYYREAWIELDNIADANIVITAKTGYAMEYPYEYLHGVEHAGLVYRIPFNEGAGRYVLDSEGHLASVVGGYDWEQNERSVHYGDYAGKSTSLSEEMSSALHLNEKAIINFGKINKLDFSNQYTITFWMNWKNAWLDVEEDFWEFEKEKAHALFSIGGLTFYTEQTRFGYTPTNRFFGESPTVYARMAAQRPSYQYSNQYWFVCLVVGSDKKLSVYINGEKGTNQATTITDSLNKLSSADLVFGDAYGMSKSYISDFKVYNRAMDDAEILDLYRGI